MKASMLVLLLLALGSSPGESVGRQDRTKADPSRGTSARGTSTALTGSPQFFPSPEHPLGWRGDGSGRFPGATPPTVWGRWAKGLVHELRHQARRPKGSELSGAQSLEFGILKEWLVAGPFAPESGLPNEAQLQPDASEKNGASAWKVVHVGIETQSNHEVNGGICGTANVDFQTVLGKHDNQVAYAHTYLFAPEAGKAVLYVRSSPQRDHSVWFNGKSVDASKVATLDVARGWNSLLVKVPGGQSSKRPWTFSAYLRPPGTIDYASKNIAWVTPLPRWSCSAPLVVGDRIYVQCGPGGAALVCVNKADGRLLWIRPYTWPALLGQDNPVADLCDEFIKLANAAVSENGPNSALQTTLETKGIQLTKAIEKANVASGKPVIHWQDGGAANPTPCSDGKRIYCVFGAAEKIVVCYDLQGKQLWMSQESVKAWEHGNHGSPWLTGGRVIVGAGDTALGLDPASGAVLWKVKDAGWRLDAATPVPIGNGTVLLGDKVLRVADGKVLGVAAPFSVLHATHGTACVEQGIAYIHSVSLGNNSKSLVSALSVSSRSAEDASVSVAWQQPLPDPMNTVSSPWNRPGFIASGLLVDELVYGVDMMGTLFVTDGAGQKVL